MPVIIQKKVRKPEAVVPPSPAETVAIPLLTKILHAGTSEILPDLDVHDVPGRTKFLINLHKIENGTSIWYQIEGYDENTGQMKLRSRHKNTFDAKLHPTVAIHYLVVMEPESATAPSKEAFAAIRKLVADPIKPK